jgi:hypothetical protein
LGAGGAFVLMLFVLVGFYRADQDNRRSARPFCAEVVPILRDSRRCCFAASRRTPGLLAAGSEGPAGHGRFYVIADDRPQPSRGRPSKPSPAGSMARSTACAMVELKSQRPTDRWKLFEVEVR